MHQYPFHDPYVATIDLISPDQPDAGLFNEDIRLVSNTFPMVKQFNPANKTKFDKDICEIKQDSKKGSKTGLLVFVFGKSAH